MEKKRLKIPPDRSTEVEEFRLPLQTILDKMIELEKELRYLETQRVAAKANFWRKVEEILPETEDGHWEWDEDSYEVVEQIQPPSMMRGLFGL